MRTTIADPAAARPPDLVDRQLGVPAPNRLLVADSTYVKLTTGVFVYVAFVIEAYAGSIVGWGRLDVIGLYKNERIRADSLFRRDPLHHFADIDVITTDYVAWFNQLRLMRRLGRVPPAGAEDHYYSKHVTDRPAGSQNPDDA